MRNSYSTQPPRRQPPKSRGLRDIPPGYVAIITAIITGVFGLGAVLLPQLRSEQFQAQQTGTVVALAQMSANTATAAAALQTNTTPATMTPTNTQFPTPTITITPSPIGTNSSTPTTLPPTVAPTIAPTIGASPLALNAATSTRVANTFPCSAIVVNPDGDATVITAIYEQASSSATSGQTTRVGDNVNVQRVSTGANDQTYYLIYAGNQRLGWILAKYLNLSETCFK